MITYLNVSYVGNSIMENIENITGVSLNEQMLDDDTTKYFPLNIDKLKKNNIHFVDNKSNMWVMDVLPKYSFDSGFVNREENIKTVIRPNKTFDIKGELFSLEIVFNIGPESLKKYNCPIPDEYYDMNLKNPSINFFNTRCNFYNEQKYICLDIMKNERGRGPPESKVYVHIHHKENHLLGNHNGIPQVHLFLDKNYQIVERNIETIYPYNKRLEWINENDIELDFFGNILYDEELMMYKMKFY